MKKHFKVYELFVLNTVNVASRNRRQKISQQCSDVREKVKTQSQHCRCSPTNWASNHNPQILLNKNLPIVNRSRV